jgi:AraC-like DNA-binding protein
VRRVAPAPVSVTAVPGLPGVVAARVEQDTRLWRGVSTRFGLTWVEEGAFDFWYRGRHHTQAAGQLKLKAPGEAHRDLRVHRPVTGVSLSLPDDLVRALAEAEGCAPRFEQVLTPAGSESARRGARLFALLRSPAPSALAVETALVQLLASLWGAAREERAAPGARRELERARALLHASVSEGASLQQLAREAGLSPFQLARGFQRTYGLPPHAYLTQLRVAKARELLERGLRGAEVAAAVGVYDQSQLHRHFVRAVGMTPGAYRSAVSARPLPTLL